MTTKICGKCKIEKEYIYFFNDKSRKSGLSSTCKECSKKYNDENKDKIKKYRKDNFERISSNYKRYYKENFDDLSKKKKIYNQKNSEKIALYSKEYNKKNIEKKRAWANSGRARRESLDCNYKIIHRLRNLIGVSIKRMGYSKTSKTFEILGCDYQSFISHIEKQFLKGMAWDNHGEWHIDHIIPIASAKNESDIIRLNHYTNLQPLWASENIKKKDKMPAIHIKNRIEVNYANSIGLKLNQLSIF